MQMFCQASAHLRCALLQGNSQVLYKPECVFITHLRMASWRAQLPKHASLCSLCTEQGHSSSDPSEGLLLFLPASVSLLLSGDWSWWLAWPRSCMQGETQHQKKTAVASLCFKLSSDPSLLCVLVLEEHLLACTHWDGLCACKPREALPGNPGKPRESKR